MRVDMAHLQIWLQKHNRRLTQAAIDEALMEYITHIESKLADLQAENELLKQVEANLAELEKQEPVAWMRKWAFDGETPVKERNSNGRMAWPHKFKILPVTEGKFFNDDVGLYAAQVVSPDVEKLKAEIVSLRQQICASQSNVMARDEYIQSLTTELVAVLKDAEHKQCRIDELILEFCPSEMTADQLNRWRKCQITAIEQAKGGA